MIADLEVKYCVSWILSFAGASAVSQSWNAIIEIQLTLHNLHFLLLKATNVFLLKYHIFLS